MDGYPNKIFTNAPGAGEAFEQFSNLMCVSVCVCGCISIHVQDSILLLGFCANSGFGNHLTSVTSCYVSPSQKDIGEDRGGEGKRQSEKQ